MGDRVGERLEVLVRALQIRGPLQDAGFEIGIERPDLGLGPVRPLSKPADDGSTRTTLLAIAQLDEGPWWWSQIVDADPAAITVGTRLAIAFERAGPGFEAVPVFRLA